jgi:hypothetical protein
VGDGAFYGHEPLAEIFVDGGRVFGGGHGR